MPENERQTKDEILKVGFQLFLKKGYDLTSVQTIIDAVGIAKGTFYHHFKSKEEMLVDLVQSLSLRVVTAIQTVVDDPDLNALQKFHKASSAAISQKSSDLGPESIVLVEQMRSSANLRLSRTMEELTSRYLLPFYEKIIIQGIEEGAFQVTYPEVVAEMVISLHLSQQRRIMDLFIQAAHGNAQAGPKLREVYVALEETLERVLGCPRGSLSIYNTIEFEKLLNRIGALNDIHSRS